MNDRKLKLVNNEKSRAEWIGRKDKKQNHTPRITHHVTRIPNPLDLPAVAGQAKSQIPNPKSLSLTPAEVAEAARFRELTAARAAQQAIIRRIMAELEELDGDVSPAA